MDSYDFSATTTGSNDGVSWDVTVTTEARVSGDDYHLIFAGYPDGGTHEQMKVEGVRYWREYQLNHPIYDNTWTLVDGAGGISPDHFLSVLGDWPVACPSVSGVTWSGEEALNGEMTTRYTSGEGPEAFDNLDYDPSLFSDSYNLDTSSHEYWVDSGGQLVQHRMNQYSQFVEEGEVRGVGHVVTLTTFSGIGEPNVITAPQLPTPTPIP